MQIKLAIYCFFTLIISGLVPSAWAQNTSLDSLNVALQASQGNDVNKVKNLILMSKALQTKSIEKSLIYAQQALLIAQRLNYQQGINDALFYIGSAYYQAENYSKALDYYLRAIQFYKADKNTAGQAISLRTAGNIHYQLGNYQDALAFHIEAYKTYDAQKDQRGIAASLGNIGIVYAALNDYQEALKNYVQALGIAQSMKDQRLIGINYNNIGTAYEKLKDYKKALEYYQYALPIFRTMNDATNTANTLNGLGDTHKKTGKKNEALKFYLEALDIQKRENDRSGMSYSYMGIGDLYSETNNPQRASEYYLQSIDLARELQRKELIRDNYQRLANTYEKLGNVNTALNYFKFYKTYNDSIYNENKLNALAELQTRFGLQIQAKETERQGKVIESLSVDKQKQQQDIEAKNRNIRWQFFIILFFVLISIVIISLLVLVIRGRNKIRVANAQLLNRNDEISRQKTEIEAQSHQLTEAFNKITDSIRYAETIQQAILPDKAKMQAVLGDYFVIAKAKDIVSGDFYWLSQVGEMRFVAVVDCTGHGVSGGFMTMIGHTLLNEIINDQGVYSPAEVLYLLNQGVSHVLEKQIQHIAIGMEISLCRIEPITDNPTQMKLTFAGAKRPLFSIPYIQTLNGAATIQELRGDRDPIGFNVQRAREYQNQEIIVEKGSLFYMVSDGFADQANPVNQRFGTPRLKKILSEIANQSLAEQKRLLENALLEFQETTAQRDDITLLGVRV